MFLIAQTKDGWIFDIATDELANLLGSNNRYQIKPSEFQAWQEVWTAKAGAPRKS